MFFKTEFNLNTGTTSMDFWMCCKKWLLSNDVSLTKESKKALLSMGDELSDMSLFLEGKCNTMISLDLIYNERTDSLGLCVKSESSKCIITKQIVYAHCNGTPKFSYLASSSNKTDNYYTGFLKMETFSGYVSEYMPFENQFGTEKFAIACISDNDSSFKFKLKKTECIYKTRRLANVISLTKKQLEQMNLMGVESDEIIPGETYVVINDGYGMIFRANRQFAMDCYLMNRLSGIKKTYELSWSYLEKSRFMAA